MNYCHDRNSILEKKWIDQSSRFQKRLLPGSFRIDEKTLTDFAAFASNYGKLIPFYNINDRPDGDWSSFFRDDPTISLLFLQALNTEKWSARSSEILTLFEHSKHEQRKLFALKELVTLSTGIFTDIERIVANIHPYQEFHGQLVKYINNRFSSFFQLVVETNKILREQYEWRNPLALNFSLSFGNYWFSDKPFTFVETDNWIESSTLSLGKSLPKIIHEITILRKETQSFLNDEVFKSGNIKPHIALFIAFCELYQHAQGKINNITERHLKYYYEDLLKLKPSVGKKDSVYVSLSLAKGSESIQLVKDTKFNCVSKKSGITEYFLLDNPVSMHEGKINQVNAMNISSLPWLGSFMNRRLSDVNVFDLQYPGKHTYELGFEISSEYLILEEGDRRITFNFSLNRIESLRLKEKWKLHFGEFSLTNLNSLISNSWFASYSNVDGMIAVEEKNLSTFFIEDSEAETLQLSFDLLIKKHEAGFTSANPDEPAEATLKLVLNSRGASFYTFFRDISFSGASLNIQVIGVKNLILQNDFGALENGHPFEPFGPRPTIGSNLYIGHKNLFLKPLKDLIVNLEWNNLPADANGFKEYYKAYEGIEDNSSFKVSLSSLKDKNWIPSENRQVIDLFTGVTSDNTLADNTISLVRRMNEIDIRLLALNSESRISGPLAEYNIHSTDGFLKLELCYPEAAFGHDQYTELVQHAAFKAVKEKREPELVNEPYTPSLKSVSLEYKAGIEIKQWDEKITFKKIHPFGSEYLNDSKEWSLLSSFPDGGSFFIGLDPVLSDKEISFLIKVSNRNVNRYEDSNTGIHISLLKENKWYALSQENITYDSTKQFQRTGIIKIKLPEIAQSAANDTIWLRFDMDNEQTGYYIENIHLNAGIVTRENFLSTDSEPLDEYAIYSLKEPIIQIEKIEQPYPSFGGRKPETNYEFKLRASERMRHKGRASSNQDIEQLLLGEFPEIQSLKCLNHLNAELKFHPGSTTIVVIPLENEESGSLERFFPKEKLAAMQNFLNRKALSGMKVSVVNPVYEKIRLKFNVKFREGYDEKLAFRNLHYKIMNFLDPWKSYKIISQGGIIPATIILNEIELENYVDFVTNFSVFHLVNDQIVNLSSSQHNNLIIKAKSPISVLIPDIHHKLLPFNDKISTDKPGINDMMIGNDFLVNTKLSDASSGLGFDVIEKTFRLSPETDETSGEKHTFTMYLKD